MVACPTTRCAYTNKNSYLIGIAGTLFNNVVDDADCSTKSILLTDDPGFIDVADEPLGAFLDNEVNRVRTLSSFEEAETHFKPWSETWQAARSFFGLDVLAGSRSGSLKVGFVADGETLLDAWNEITDCSACAWNVTVVHYKTNGDPYVDTVELFDLQASIRTNKEYDIFVPTIEASLIFTDPFRTTSQDALAAQSGSDANYVVLSYYCGVFRDENGDPVVGNGVDILDPDGGIIPDGETFPLNYYSYDALLAASHATSYSQYGTNYNFTLHRKPISYRTASTATGLYLDETTGEPMKITEEQIKIATGIDGYIAGAPNFIQGATASTSGYFRFPGGITYLESLRVNREQFTDVWYKEKAFNNLLQTVVVNYTAGKQALGISKKEALALAGLIQASVISTFINNGVINPQDFDWAGAGYDNILLQGQGYVITLRPLSELTQATISQRNGYALGVCVLINEPTHRIAINLCEFPVIATEG